MISITRGRVQSSNRNFNYMTFVCVFRSKVTFRDIRNIRRDSSIIKRFYIFQIQHEERKLLRTRDIYVWNDNRPIE